MRTMAWVGLGLAVFLMLCRSSVALPRQSERHMMPGPDEQSSQVSPRRPTKTLYHGFSSASGVTASRKEEPMKRITRFRTLSTRRSQITL